MSQSLFRAKVSSSTATNANSEAIGGLAYGAEDVGDLDVEEEAALDEVVLLFAAAAVCSSLVDVFFDPKKI